MSTMSEDSILIETRGRSGSENYVCNRERAIDLRPPEYWWYFELGSEGKGHFDPREISNDEWGALGRVVAAPALLGSLNDAGIIPPREDDVPEYHGCFVTYP